MKTVCRGGFENDCAQRAYIAAAPIVAISRLPRFCMQPRSRSSKHAVGGSVHQPGLGRTIVIRENTFDRGFGRDMADAARADTVRKRDSNPFRAEKRLFRNQDAMKILIGLLAPL